MSVNRPVLQWNKILLKIDIFYDKACHALILNRNCYKTYRQLMYSENSRKEEDKKI
jgi:hypothetical protein